jgi:N-acetylglucosaminyl-diphospho-decaprenol L-rhamnosyltransferase
VDKFPSRERSASVALEPRVTAVVVARNTRPGASGQSPLDLCLRSALAEPWIDDLVVVDHGNPAKISSALRALQADRRDVKIVVAAADASNPAAANLGAEKARGRWLLFLDPDVVLRRGAVARMAAAGGDASAPYIIGGRLTDTDGRERRAARGGALNTWSAIAVALNWPARKPRKRRADEAAQVAAVSGALMLIQRSDFETLGRFDEGFATDGADLDLCRRAAEQGGSVLFQPAATGVQFAHQHRSGRQQVQGLALFASKSAKTPVQRAFAFIAKPALATLVVLRDFVIGRPPVAR